MVQGSETISLKCRKCEEVKPLQEFNRDRSKKLGVRSICRPCHRSEAKEYAVPRRLEYTERSSKWYRDNKQRKQEYDRQWRPAYLDRNRSIFNANTNRRRSRLRSSQPGWANKFFMDEIYRLALLRTKSTGIWWSVDHIVPIKSDLVCGLHCEANLRVITQSENASKNNRHWPDMP